MRIQRHRAAAWPAAFLLAGVSFAQLETFPRTWSRTYGGASSEGLYDLRRLPGGRLAVAGYSASFGGPFHSNWLLNVGLENGDVLFESVSSTVQGGVVDGASLAADGGALLLQRTDRRGGITHCDLVRTTAFATVSPPISVQNTAFVRVLGGARTQDMQAQVGPSQALVTDRCD